MSESPVSTSLSTNSCWEDTPGPDGQPAINGDGETRLTEGARRTPRTVCENQIRVEPEVRTDGPARKRGVLHLPVGTPGRLGRRSLGTLLRRPRHEPRRALQQRERTGVRAQARRVGLPTPVAVRACQS